MHVATPRFVVFACFLLSVNTVCLSQKWALKGTITNSPFHDGMATFIKDDLYGVMNASGEIVIPAKYKFIQDFNAGMAPVIMPDGKYGLIDRHDHFVLQPIYKFIHAYEEEKVSGLYKITSEDGKEGLFYNGRLVLPVEYESIYTWYYPLVEYVKQDDSHQVLNLVTGDVYDSQYEYGDMYVCKRQGVNHYVDKTTGERADTTLFAASSLGVVAFQDDATKLFGFKNKNTGAITIKPKYLSPAVNMWENDAMIMCIDSMSKVKPKRQVLIDCYGKEHDLCTSNEERMYFNGGYVEVSSKQGDKTKYGIYTNKGEQVLPLSETSWYPVSGEKDWFTDRKRLFDAINKITYPGYANRRSCDMFAMHNDSNSYYINAVTRERIKGDYHEVYDFSEGVGRVHFSKDYNDVGFVDKKGKVVLRGSKELKILDDDFSEGVVGAYLNDGNDFYDGYIYNPLGSGDYVYNASDKMAADWSTLRNWKEIADEAFEKKQYGKAKDYYYRIMMNKPDEAEAILNYGNCLNNLGYYDEAIECFELALDIDPSYELAQKNLDISLENKRIIEEREEREAQEAAERGERESSHSNTFWDALGSFASVLGNISGAANMYQSYSSFSSDYSSGSSGGGGGNYQSQYDTWARRAESNYNSLTNLGYSTTRKDGSKRGGTLQSMNGGNYVQMKKNLRDAQREMKRIRNAAARNGVTITASPWESATVGY